MGQIPPFVPHPDTLSSPSLCDPCTQLELAKKGIGLMVIDGYNVCHPKNVNAAILLKYSKACLMLYYFLYCSIAKVGLF